MATAVLTNAYSTNFVQFGKSESFLGPKTNIENKSSFVRNKNDFLLPSKLFCRSSSFKRSVLLGHHGKKFKDKTNFTTTVTSKERENFIPKAQVSPVTETVDMEQEGDEGSETEKFVWEKNWYPVALIEDLPVSKPVPFQLLGINMVLWRDSEGRWRAFKDACPHRLAPLSEGRLDSQGFLQCSYHGWSFSGSGACQSLPQADPRTSSEARARESPRACARAYPSKESQGMLFVWPDEYGGEEAASTEPPRLPAVFDDPSYSTVTIQRDLFYGYDILMENVSDPSHIDFAHHKVTGRRDRARPLPFKVEKSGPNGFVGSGEGNPKIISSFQAPVYFENKLELKVPLPILGEQNWEIWICSFNVPMAPGKTRSIVCSARNFSQLTVPGNNWWQIYPRWLEHLTSNLIYDGDMLVLKGQENVLCRTGKSGKQIPYGRATFTPTAADRFVLAFRNWLRRYGGGEPKWEEGIKREGMELPSTRMSKREMLDRLSQHTEICSSCNGALKGVKRASYFFASLAVLLLASATLPSEFSQRLILAGGAVFSAGITAWLKLYLEQQFIFVDYNHSDIPD